MPNDPREVLSRPAPPPDATVAYGDDPLQIADLHLPAPEAATGAPVVFVHGGFWMPAFDRVHARPLVAGLVAAGHPVANVEYRRTGQPGGGWPGTCDDVADAIRSVPTLLATAMAERGDDVARMSRPILMGHSAGGHLALWAAHECGPDTVDGVVALAPVADLARAYALALGGGAVVQWLGGSPTEVPDHYAAADPAANLPIGVPIVVIAGELDAQVPYEIGRAFVEAARAAGDDARFIGLANTDHFALIDPESAAWPAVLQAVMSLTAGNEGGGSVDRR